MHCQTRFTSWLWSPKAARKYKVSHLLVDWIGLTWILSVPLCARFCLGWLGIWQKRLVSWAGWWNTLVKVNRTQVLKQMGHLVRVMAPSRWKWIWMFVRSGRLTSRRRATHLMLSSTYIGEMRDSLDKRKRQIATQCFRTMLLQNFGYQVTHTFCKVL